MPPAIIGVIATIASVVVAHIGLSALVVALLTIAISIAAAIAISLTQGSKPNNQRTNQGTELKLKLDPGMPRQLALGTCASGGSVVWAFTYGSTSQVPNNAYLVRIVALSDLPINNLVGIFEGKDQLTFAGDVTAGLQACNQHHAKDGSPCLWVHVHKGSPAAIADADVIGWSGGQWTANHKGTNEAYAVTRALFDGNGDAFPNGEPQLVYVMDGVSVYDQRQDGSRPARTGTQRLATPSTWAFSQNVAVLSQQVLRGFYSNGVLLIGAQAEERDLDDSMLLSAYNTCDESVANLAGGTQPRYRAGYMISSVQTTADILLQMQAAMDGKILDRGGNITLRPGATHTPVFNLTDTDILWDQEHSWQPRLDLGEIYNFVDGVFVDEETIFNEKPFPPLRDPAYEAQDGGGRLEFQIGYSAVTNWSQVQRMTKRIFLQSRLQGTVGFLLPLWGMEMEQDDWFTLNSTRWNFNKSFVCVSADLVMAPNLCVQVIGREVSSTIDGWNAAIDEKPRGDTYWTGGVAPVLPVPTLTPTAIKKTSTIDQTEQFGVSIIVTNLGPNTGIATNMEIQIAPQADHTLATTVPGSFAAYNQTTEYYGLIASGAYSLRARTYNATNQSNWSAWVDFTAEGSGLGYSLVVTTNQVLQADAAGVVTPASQLPKTIVTDVVRNGVSLKTDNSVSYSVVTAGCSATIDNVVGSATKGDITLTSLPNWTAYIYITTTINGIAQPLTTITLSKSTAASGGGGDSIGGSGAKFFQTSTLSPVAAAGDVVITPVGTVTLAGGESLYGVGTVSYYFAAIGGGYSEHLTARWQYAAHGSGVWNNFAAGIVGADAYSGTRAGGGGGGFFYDGGGYGDTDPPYDGSVDMAQTKGGLAAGDYDIRLVAVQSDVHTLDCYGTVRVDAKV